MGERLIHGSPASPGVALGAAWHLLEHPDMGESVPSERREQERRTAVSALAATAEALTNLGAGLPAQDAEIIETGALMAQDPALIQDVEDAIVDGGMTAAAAIVRATEAHASRIERIGDRTLAARADDVRSLGRRAAGRAAGRAAEPPPETDVILIAHDLGPADVAELPPRVVGVALAGGATTAHAAIVARSLGVPMVTGLYEQVMAISSGVALALDGSLGTLTVEPATARARSALEAMAARRAATGRAHELRDQPAVTTDGKRIRVLANVASPEELAVGLRAGAEGIGLLRTELAFLAAHDWPSEQQHTEALEPILSGLGNRPAVVRVLDFGVDKAPPFLRDVSRRGLELLLAHPDAFVGQLRAILLAAQCHDVRVMLPMVDRADQVAQAAELVRELASELGSDRVPPLGAMIETPAAANDATAIAAQSDFLSVGTNDLTAATLQADRFAVNTACAHHPLVLRSIARSVAAAHADGIRIEVCGEAASDPFMLPLLVGLGVDELSVGAARVGWVRDWIRQLDYAETVGLARSALTMDDAQEVEWALRPLAAQHVLSG